MNREPLELVNPVLYQSNPKRCGICGGTIHVKDGFHQEMDIFYHGELETCVIELQKTAQTHWKIIDLLRERNRSLRKDFGNFLRGLVRSKWGPLAKAKMQTYRLFMLNDPRRDDG